jgi:multisubunit Na+/H+ antiporter MnhB subunit
LLYQLVVSAPMMALTAIVFGERPRRARLSDPLVVSVTFVLWFALIVRYSANRLSAFTFLTPLFGAAAGHLGWASRSRRPLPPRWRWLPADWPW